MGMWVTTPSIARRVCMWIKHLQAARLGRQGGVAVPPPRLLPPRLFAPCLLPACTMVVMGTLHSAK